jgi:hypothetical protein
LDPRSEEKGGFAVQGRKMVVVHRSWKKNVLPAAGDVSGAKQSVQSRRTHAGNHHWSYGRSGVHRSSCVSNLSLQPVSKGVVAELEPRKGCREEAEQVGEVVPGGKASASLNAGHRVEPVCDDVRDGANYACGNSAVRGEP